MSMVRVKIWTALITLAVVAGVIAFRDEWGRPDPRTDVEEVVVVQADWEPTNRGTRPIEVEVTAEGVPLLEDRLVRSPWSRTFRVPKGATVTATFTQPTAGRLSCRVDRPSRIGEPGHRDTAGELICRG